LRAWLVASRALSPAAVVPVALVAAILGAGVGQALKKEKRVYGKGLNHLLPNDASLLAKNIA